MAHQYYLPSYKAEVQGSPCHFITMTIDAPAYERPGMTEVER